MAEEVNRVLPVIDKIRNSRSDWFHLLNKDTGKRHGGLDLYTIAQDNDNVVSPADGTVVRVMENTDDPVNKTGFKGYGPAALVIQDDQGLYHLLAHLDPKFPSWVKKGAPVKHGQIIGTTAQKGWTRNRRHVHWEVRGKLNYSGKPDEKFAYLITVDPVRWLEKELLSGYQAEQKVKADPNWKLRGDRPYPYEVTTAGFKPTEILRKGEMPPEKKKEVEPHGFSIGIDLGGIGTIAVILAVIFLLGGKGK